jgi:hypothetical protein
MSVGARLGSRTRPENTEYTTLPSEHVTTAKMFTTVLTSRSDTEKPALKGDEDTVPSRL